MSEIYCKIRHKKVSEDACTDKLLSSNCDLKTCQSCPEGIKRMGPVKRQLASAPAQPDHITEPGKMVEAAEPASAEAAAHGFNKEIQSSQVEQFVAEQEAEHERASAEPAFDLSGFETYTPQGASSDYPARLSGGSLRIHAKLLPPELLGKRVRLMVNRQTRQIALRFVSVEGDGTLSLSAQDKEHRSYKLSSRGFARKFGFDYSGPLDAVLRGDVLILTPAETKAAA